MQGDKEVVLVNVSCVPWEHLKLQQVLVIVRTVPLILPLLMTGQFVMVSNVPLEHSKLQ